MSTPHDTLSCEEARDILAVQALEGSLAVPEPGVEAHIRDCEACQAIRREYEDITGLLVFALPDTPASHAVRDRLRLRLASERRPGRPAWFWPATVAAGLAATLALGVLLGALLWRGDSSDASLPVDASRSEHYVLRGHEAAGGSAWGEVLVDEESGTALVLAYDLPPLDSDTVYQFWFTRRDGTRLDAKIFWPDQHGRALHLVNLPEDWQDIRGMWVTREPAPGSEVPQGPNVLVTWW